MKKIEIEELIINPFTKIGSEWMLITAGNKERGFNTMTASWGHLGDIWGSKTGKPSAIIYIRPQRFTKEFVDEEEYFTLSFFPSKYKKALSYLGAHSGRDENKIQNSGLNILFEDDYCYFKESKLVLVCRKLYHSSIVEDGFVDKKYNR